MFEIAWSSFLSSPEVDQNYINQMQIKTHAEESWSEIYFWHYLERGDLHPIHRGPGCSDSEIFWRDKGVQFENVAPKRGEEGSAGQIIHRRILSCERLAAGKISDLWKVTESDREELRSELDLVRARVTQGFVYKADQFSKRINKGLVKLKEQCVIVIGVNQFRKVEYFDIADVGGR